MYFALRVELHGEPHDSDKYKRLHVAMENIGFSRKVQAGDGKWYQLPPAEYVYESGGTLTTVADAAKKTADSIGPSTVMVHQSETWAGRALKPAT